MAKESADKAAGNGCWKKHVQVIGLTAGLLGVIAILVINICFGRASAVEGDLEEQDIRLQAVECAQAAQQERDRAIMNSLAEIKADIKELRKRGDL